MLSRRGFTLIEVAAALAIALVLAAVIAPSVMSRYAQSQTGALINNLTGLTRAAMGYKTDVGRYPRRLTYLSTAITAGTQDLCGISVPNVTLWDGPYSERIIPASGVETGSSVISDTLTRSPASAVYTTAAGNLVFTVREVDESSALRVDENLDGDGSLATGAVQWTVGTVPGRGSLYYRVPIRGC